MSSRLDEIDASMDTVVDNIHSVDLVFGFEVGVEPLLNVFHNGSPRIVIVDKVSEAWCINDCQTQSDPILFDVGTYRLDRDGSGDDVEAGSFSLLWRVKRGVEQGIDQC